MINSEIVITVDDRYKRHSNRPSTQPQVTSFEQLGLKEEVLKGIYSCGFEKPSAIQQSAIPVMISNPQSHLIAQTRFGSGRTASYAIAMLERVETSKTHVQALVLVPTRELAYNIGSFVENLGHYVKMKLYKVIGGISLQSDIQVLQQGGVHILVGTPGRVLHHIHTGYLDLSNLKMVVLDEADSILSYGFKEMIIDILKSIPKDVQFSMFSATMPNEVLEIADMFMDEYPIRIFL